MKAAQVSTELFGRPVQVASALVKKNIMRKPRVDVTLAVALLVWLNVSMLAARGQPPSSDRADWPMYNHDPAGWRFNPAEKTVGPANVGKLVEKWRFPAASSKLDSPGAPPG